MKTVRRFDRTQLTKIEKTPQGFVRLPAFVTRVGVFKYKKPDGSIVRELRPPDEVFSPKSLETLKLIPVTNDHPTVLVNADNAKQLAVGWTGELVKKNDQFLETTLTIHDNSAIQDVEGGKHELSCGYESELDETPGVFQGEPYDVIQRNIQYNHVALVAKGRAGPQVRLKLDSDDAILFEDQDTKGGKMDKLMIGGKEFEVSPEMKAAIEAEMAKLQQMEMDMAEMKKDMGGKEEKKAELEVELDSAKKEKDALQAKYDEAMEQLKVRKDSADEKTVHALVQKRIKLEKVAGDVLGKETKFDADLDMDIMKKVISKKYPEFNFEGRSAEYVQARFDAIAEMVEGTEKTVDDFGKNKQTRNDGVPASADEARKKMIEESMQAHKTHVFAAKKKGE